jgi:hypothetical protein
MIDRLRCGAPVRSAGIVMRPLLCCRFKGAQWLGIAFAGALSGDGK